MKNTTIALCVFIEHATMAFFISIPVYKSSLTDYPYGICYLIAYVGLTLLSIIIFMMAVTIMAALSSFFKIFGCCDPIIK